MVSYAELELKLSLGIRSSLWAHPRGKVAEHEPRAREKALCLSLFLGKVQNLSVRPEHAKPKPIGTDKRTCAHTPRLADKNVVTVL